MSRIGFGDADGWLITPAAATDLDALIALEASAFPHPWSRALVSDELAHPHAILLTARAAAAGEVGAYAAFRVLADESELLRIATSPPVRGRGAARALLEAGLVRLAAAGCSRCHLEVRVDNTAAIALYQRRGFERQGLRRGYYADGGDAVLFALDLQGERDVR